MFKELQEKSGHSGGDADEKVDDKPVLQDLRYILSKKAQRRKILKQ